MGGLGTAVMRWGEEEEEEEEEGRAELIGEAISKLPLPLRTQGGAHICH